MLPPEASALDRAKFDFCEQILIDMKKKEITQGELAKAFQTLETRASDILHYRIQKFTLDRLIRFLQIFRPMLTVKVSSN